MCVHAFRARDGARERESWGFVYDFVRCSFDALFFPPNLSFHRDFTDYTCATIVMMWYVKFDDYVA